MTILADDYVLQLALNKGWLSPARIDSAQAIIAGRAGPAAQPSQLVDLLVSEGVLTAWQLAQLRAEEFGLQAVDLTTVQIEREVLALVPRTLAERYRVMPLARAGSTLQVAISDPLDLDGIDSLGHTLKLTIETLIAPEEDIVRVMDRFYGPKHKSQQESTGSNAPSDRSAITRNSTQRLTEELAEPNDGEAPIIKLAHTLILEATQRRASDIHLEPLEKRFRVRYRIDGVLHEVDNPPKRLQLALISRLKIMANISIAERRIPQDGRIQLTFGGRSLDLRVSTLPTVHGESMALRILDKENLQLGLPELGFLRDDQALFERLISLPDGLMLVTGPTGSGKTTTLYGCLHHLNQPDRKIITVEDPVEYQLTGINQVPVRHEIGMTFGSALRAMLRQSPNTVMIGEIRDLETAEIALNASLTGHMVFSTLHTNDAPGAVTRLLDIGVKPYLLSTALRAVMAQRLVRKICAHCRQPYTPTPAELGALDLSRAQATAATFMRGAGCPECAGTGYNGRTGIFEIFVINEEVQRMIHERAGSARLRAKVRALGMRTMRADGARKVIAGLTTIEEVVSITVGDAS